MKLEMDWPTEILQAVHRLSELLEARRWMMATAESCTGGLIASACTEQSGAAVWFDRGLITYSNRAKTELLGVPAQLIDAHGAVSEPVARAMACGAAQVAQTEVAVAVTGVAGPTGGSPDKPVGTVWFGWSVSGQVKTERVHFDGERQAVRMQTVAHALDQLSAFILRRVS